MTGVIGATAFVIVTSRNVTAANAALALGAAAVLETAVERMGSAPRQPSTGDTVEAITRRLRRRGSTRQVAR